MTAPAICVRSNIGDFPVMLNLEGAARLLNISRPTLARMLERGTIEGRKGGTRWVIPTQSVLRYLSIDSEVMVNV
jgi:excisionase family DNA binding protein